MSPKTKAVAGRVDPETVRRLDQAANECGITRSELVGRIVKSYIDRNPEDIEALRPDDPLESMDAFTKDLIK